MWYIKTPWSYWHITPSLQHWLYKMFARYILSSVFLSLFSPSTCMQHLNRIVCYQLIHFSSVIDEIFYLNQSISIIIKSEIWFIIHCLWSYNNGICCIFIMFLLRCDRKCKYSFMFPELNSVGQVLTDWGRVTHICVSNPTIIGSDDGLSPSRRQTIIGTNAGILLIRPLGTNFSEILIEIRIFSLKNAF